MVTSTSRGTNKLNISSLANICAFVKTISNPIGKKSHFSKQQESRMKEVEWTFRVHPVIVWYPALTWSLGSNTKEQKCSFVDHMCEVMIMLDACAKGNVFIHLIN